MRNLLPVTTAAAMLLTWMSGCGVAGQRLEYMQIERSAAAPPRPSIPAETPDRELDARLAREAPLDSILQLVQQRNPELLEARARVQASLAKARVSSRLPDLEFKYEQWGVPLDRPLRLDEAQTLMFGLRQTFPAAGSRGAQERVSLQEAWMALDALRGRERALLAQARRGYYDLYRAEREYEIHLEHVELADRVVGLARSNYQVGRGTQQDVLSTLVELSRLHNDVAQIEQERRSSRALLNALLARRPDAPLAVPPEPEVTTAKFHVAELDSLLLENRPELDAAEHGIRRGQATLDLAKSQARWPDIMVGADYWLMPGMDPKHAYGAMVSFSLPWFNPAHRREVRAAELELESERRVGEAALNMARYELHDALARLEASRQSLTVIVRDLLPQARQNFESARAAFAAGQGNALGVLDALRSQLDVQLQRSRALASMQANLSDLERAVGVSLSEFPESSRGGRP